MHAADTRSKSTLRRSYRFLLRPTRRQAALLAECLEDCRQIYNAALEERREAWRWGVRIGFNQQSAQMPAIRAADLDGLGRWAMSSIRAPLRRADRTFQAFFRRCKAGAKPGYPRFKGHGSYDSIDWPDASNGCGWVPAVGRVYLKGIGHVRVHAHREVRGVIKTVSVKREGRRWCVVFSCDKVPAEPLPPTGRTVGIDMGIASFLTTSHGEHVENPRWLERSADRLAEAQRVLSRCSRWSNRRRKARRRAAAIHAQIKHQRQDFHRKLALDLVQRYDAIVHESLAIANMTRSASGTVEEPGTKVAAKSGLNRSILDAGWGLFLQTLASTAERACRQQLEVEPRHTSQTCPNCGTVDPGNRVSQARFVCIACGFRGHADAVAALVIERLGLNLREAERPNEKPQRAAESPLAEFAKPLRSRRLPVLPRPVIGRLQP